MMHKIMKRPMRAFLTAAALALSSLAAAQSPPPNATPGPALWEVKDKDTTIYLFGTVHLLPHDASWLDSRIERALTSADEFVMEVDPADVAKVAQATAAVQAYLLLPEGQTLRGLMTDEKRRDYEAALASLGVPAEALDKMKPWAAAASLGALPLLRAGYDLQNGVESTLNVKAGPDKKRGGLETGQEQVALFEGLSTEAQLAFLDRTVKQLPEGKALLDAMVEDWRKGDPEHLGTLVNGAVTDPELHARLLTNRNANWVGWIQRRLAKPGTVFIAVGAGHLAGRDSVQEQLQKRGLKVTRVWQ